jgi:hypothetical protein
MQHPYHSKLPHFRICHQGLITYNPENRHQQQIGLMGKIAPPHQSPFVSNVKQSSGSKS